MPTPALVPKMRPKQLQPKLRIDTIYLKPLGRDIIQHLDPAAALRKLKNEMLKRMRRALTQETFSKAAKKALAQALTIKVGKSSLLISTNHPAWKPLVEGQRHGQMKWLAKAKAPIPIVLDSGEVIFRSVTARSLADGKWVHPGRQESHFYDRAREEAREFLRQNLAGQVRRQLVQAFK